MAPNKRPASALTATAEEKSGSVAAGSDEGGASAGKASTAAAPAFSEDFKTRLQMFQEKTKDMTAQDMEPLLRTHFAEGEISNYWNKIKREIPRAGGALQKTWSEISEMQRGQGQQVAKRQVLSLFISKPDVWTQHAVRQVNTRSKIREKEETNKWMSRGELIVKVG